MSEQYPFIQLVKNNLALIAVIVGMVVTYANMANSIDQNTRDISTLTNKVGQIEPTFIEIQKDIVEIKTTLEFIKESVAK